MFRVSAYYASLKCSRLGIRHCGEELGLRAASFSWVPAKTGRRRRWPLRISRGFQCAPTVFGITQDGPTLARGSGIRINLGHRVCCEDGMLFGVLSHRYPFRGVTLIYPDAATAAQ